jgi:hypothetical protein
MKKNYTFVKALVFSFSIISLIACKKDDNASSTVKDYIDASTGTVIGGTIPAESGSEISATISANKRATHGGSCKFKIETESTFTDLLISIKGVSNYYKIPASELDSSNGNYFASFLFKYDLPENSFTIIAELYNQSTKAVGGRIEIEVNTAEQITNPILTVTLTWDLYNDLDLHLVEPSGHVINYLNMGSINYDWYKIALDHPNSGLDSLTDEQKMQYILDNDATTGILDKDSEAGCMIDSLNIENISYIFDSDILDGDYIVKVDYFSDCLGAGSTSYNVEVKYGDQLVTPTSGTNPYNGTFASGTADYGITGDGVEVMRFNVSNLKSAEDKTQRIILEDSDNDKINFSKIKLGLGKMK